MLDSGKCVPATANIAPGKVVFEVRNAGKLPTVFGILQLPPWRRLSARRFASRHPYPASGC